MINHPDSQNAFARIRHARQPASLKHLASTPGEPELNMRNTCPIERSRAMSRPYGVLIADSGQETRHALEWGLQRAGFSIWLAADGQEAVEQYRECRESIDVLLLAIDMPILDGPTALAMLQALDSEIACCFMSGSLTGDALQSLRSRGLSAVLTNPINIPFLADRIRSLAQTSAMRRELARHRVS